MPYEIPPLQIIGETLEDEGYVWKLLPANDARPVDLLLVALGEEADPAIILELTFVNDLLLHLGLAEEYDDALVLQFLVRFTFSFADAAAPEIALLFMGLNRALPAGAFGLSEAEGTVYYQYALHLPNREVTEEVLGSVMSTIATFVPGFYPTIQAVAEGRVGHAEALAQLEDQGFKIPPLLPGPGSLLEPEENP